MSAEFIISHPHVAAKKLAARERVFVLAELLQLSLPHGSHAQEGPLGTLMLSVPRVHVALAQSEIRSTEHLESAVHDAKLDLDHLIERSGRRDQGIVFIPFYATITRSRIGAEDMARRRLSYELEPARGPHGNQLVSLVTFVLNLQRDRVARRSAMDSFGQAFQRHVDAMRSSSDEPQRGPAY